MNNVSIITIIFTIIVFPMQAAKDCVSRGRQEGEDGEVALLRKELGEVRQKMEKLEDIARKLDQLLLRS